MRTPIRLSGRPGVELCVLGRISVEADGREHVLGSTREAALLADLIVHAGEVVPASRLIDDLWRGEPPPSAQGTLQTYVKNLRRMLEPSRPSGAPSVVLVSRRPGYVLNVETVGLDAWRCERLIDEGRAALAGDDPELAVDRFGCALALWRGPAYGDLASESYVQSEAARLEELRLVAIEHRVQADLALGHHAELCGELEAHVATHPYRERLWAHWMLALYRSGRQADALRAYRRLRRVLGDELGIDPSEELRDLEEAILLHKADLDWTPPPSHRAPGVPSNLPAERSVFVGRRRELSTIAGLVRSARLVTLTGVGGVGKTRLAVQTAAGLVGEFPNGVWLVELAPLIDSALVAATVASALGVSLAGGVDSTEAVCRFLAERRALVILDNCEHVIGAAAALVDRLLAAAPLVQVLATSREPLDIAGESAWRVPSLSLDGDADALALFAERAAQAQPGVSLADPAIADSAMAVCRRLDGIPLAIELAAARAKVLSVDQIAAHLDERFRLLTGGGRTAVPRQQTLQGAIGWSYDLLTAAERSLFDTLGVFVGEFDLDAVATVASLDSLEALDRVEQLVNKSMVEADPARDRYRLLETLRQYAWERLVAGGRLSEVRDAHAASFGDLAARQARRMSEGGQHVDALDRLDADYDNLRAALAWLIEQRRADAAAGMVRRLSGLFQMRHPREGLGWFQAVVAIGGDLPVKVRARVLAGAAWAALHAGDVEATARYASAAIEAGGDESASATDWLLALVAIWAGNYARAAEHLRREIPSAVANKDLTRQTFATGVLVLALAELGDEPEARRLIPEATGLAERLGDPSMLAITYEQVAVALVRMGAPHEAVTMWERGLIHVDMAGPTMACGYRCSYALKVDDPRRAARILGVAIPIAKEQLSGFQQAHPLLAAAAIAAATGRERIAARLLGAFNQHGKGTGFVNVSRDNENLASWLHDRLGAAVVEAELARGARLAIAQALQLAEDMIVAMT
jgi:predicted ATPase/DNA-binding SARP family transcriptional activator